MYHSLNSQHFAHCKSDTSHTYNHLMTHHTGQPVLARIFSKELEDFVEAKFYCRWSAMTRTVMQSLECHLWRLRIVTSTKLRQYNAHILPIMLYGSECWTVKKADVQRIDALDQWCLWRMLDVRWHDFIRNDAVRQMIQQLYPLLSSRADSLCLDMSLEWMSWLTPIEFCLRNRRITGRPREAMLHLDSKCLQWPVLIWHGAARSQLRTNLSGGC